ncbi:MAG TPA: polysaccharide biosynthesis/export family protein [Terriglobales bacterium]|jgi:polysaccharide export outer membrane protein|nr:polysaccharide biosynthesis/export family protein [Terriglobales bacterium]
MRSGVQFGKVFALFLILAGTASTQTATTASGTTSAVPATAAAESSTPRQHNLDSNIRLGSGDVIEMNVYNVPELTTKTRIGDSGSVDLPLINEVHIEGLTVNEAEKAIEQRLDQGGFVRNPHVQLFVAEYTSQSASVLGEVVHPGLYPVLGEQRLFSVLSAAGGLSDRAGKAITVTHRAEPDKPIVVSISRNLEDHQDSNVPVYPGDTVMVRRADVVYVVGDVARPSGFLMDNGGKLSVLQAIALAGGTNPTAKLGAARIIRKGSEGVNEIPVSLKRLLQAKSGDVPLEADDILFVPASARKIISGRTAEAALQMATAATIVAIRP